MLKKIIIILCLFLLIMCCCSREKEEEFMAIEFDATELQGIEFPTLAEMPEVLNLTRKTYVVFLNIDSFPAGSTAGLILLTGENDPVDGDSSEAWALFHHAGSGTFEYYHNFGEFNGGSWITDSAVLTVGTDIMMVLTYDANDTANEPSIYVNDTTAEAISVDVAPVGTMQTRGDSKVYIGSNTVYEEHTPIDGTIYLVAIFDRILTAEEIASIMEQRNVAGIAGCVFLINGFGASGVKSIGGHSLSSDNVVVDQINGYIGVPNETPDGQEDNYIHKP